MHNELYTIATSLENTDFWLIHTLPIEQVGKGSKNGKNGGKFSRIGDCNF